jgi:hypothetical protein
LGAHQYEAGPGLRELTVMVATLTVLAAAKEKSTPQESELGLP